MTPAYLASLAAAQKYPMTPEPGNAARVEAYRASVEAAFNAARKVAA